MVLVSAFLVALRTRLDVGEKVVYWILRCWHEFGCWGEGCPGDDSRC